MRPMTSKNGCRECGGRFVFWGRVAPLGREPGVEFYRCEGCGAIAEESVPPTTAGPRPAMSSAAAGAA